MIVYGNVAGIVHRELQPLPDGAERPKRRAWNRRKVVLDGAVVFDSANECATAIGCHPASISAAIRRGRPCLGHEVAYVEEVEGQCR